jgi:3-oxosteroid 1-dehydrogenase
MAAALAAVECGAAVSMLERAPAAGGTTAYSAGTAWLPRDGEDPSAALGYLAGLAHGATRPEMLDAFAVDAVRVREALERGSRLRWRPLQYPDYHAERAGAVRGGRSFEPEPLTSSEALRALIRTVPFLRTPSPTGTSAAAWSADAILLRRALETSPDALTGGRALVGALLEAALAGGLDLRLASRVTGLAGEHGDVKGVSCEGEILGGRVVLATGGFERSTPLVSSFLGPPHPVALGAPECEGDGLRMAMAAGAGLDNMSEAWWCPAFRVPGETFGGVDLHRISVSERARPGGVVVDANGRRFADESQDYASFGRAMRAYDAGQAEFRRGNCWLMFDAGYRRRYNLGPLTPDDADPEWLLTGRTVADLARRMSIIPEMLEATVTRFNGDARMDRDGDFSRGSRAYGRFLGDVDAPHPTLAPLAEPPFYAIPLVSGCLGTNGGPVIDHRGRVLRVADGRPIAGLYAAGNVAGSPLGLAYPGAGGTIGPALVFGYRAGEAAAGDA